MDYVSEDITSPGYEPPNLIIRGIAGLRVSPGAGFPFTRKSIIFRVFLHFQTFNRPAHFGFAEISEVFPDNRV